PNNRIEMTGSNKSSCLRPIRNPHLRRSQDTKGAAANQANPGQAKGPHKRQLAQRNAECAETSLVVLCRSLREMAVRGPFKPPQAASRSVCPRRSEAEPGVCGAKCV